MNEQLETMVSREDQIVRKFFGEENIGDFNYVMRKVSNEKYHVSVDELDVSLRVRNAFDRLGVKTIGDLVLKRPSDFLVLRNFRMTSFRELVDVLRSYNQGLRYEKPASAFTKKRSERILQISELAKQGATRGEIAESIGVSYSHLFRLIRESGIKMNRARKSKVEIGKLGEMMREGKTLKEMGEFFGVGKERVRQVIEKRFVEQNGARVPLYDVWRRSAGIYRNLGKRNKLVGEAMGEVLRIAGEREAYEKATWAEQKALECIAGRERTYLLDTL